MRSEKTQITSFPLQTPFIKPFSFFVLFKASYCSLVFINYCRTTRIMEDDLVEHQTRDPEPTASIFSYLRSTPPSSEALRHSGGESRRCISATVTLYFDVELSRLNLPGTEQNTSLGFAPPVTVTSKWGHHTMHLYNSSDGRVVRVSASAAVDPGLIPSRVKPITLKLIFTASLLDAQH